MRPLELIIVLLAIVIACSVAIAAFVVLALVITKLVEAHRQKQKQLLRRLP